MNPLRRLTTIWFLLCMYPLFLLVTLINQTRRYFSSANVAQLEDFVTETLPVLVNEAVWAVALVIVAPLWATIRIAAI
ncbi:MAG: hypothetical protein AAF629_00035 [Chloroflexota bacterium]